MGYFPNGTLGRAYQERYCENCVHDVDQNCAVWLAHLVSRGDEKQEVLDLLIPDDGDIGCLQCNMFIPTAEANANAAWLSQPWATGNIEDRMIEATGKVQRLQDENESLRARMEEIEHLANSACDKLKSYKDLFNQATEAVKAKGACKK